MADIHSPAPEFDPRSEKRWDADIALPEARTNMQVTFMHRIEAALMSGLFVLFRGLGVDKASAFMGKLLRFIGPLFWPIHKRGIKSISTIYPDKSPEEVRSLVGDVWENLGRTVAEYSYLPRFFESADEPRVTLDNPAKLEELAASGKQFIFVSAHIANWELMAPILYRSGIRNAAVYRAANNPIIDQRIIELRAQGMSRILIPKGKRGARDLIKALNNGLSLCMLVDQKLNSGILSPFLGIPAMTAPATARMALKFDVPVVPIRIEREEGANFRFFVEDPIAFDATGQETEDVQVLTDKVNEAIGDMIHKAPGQWLWLHRRWPKEQG
jgi:KDO2-lipid IV(A) lauroyltransferase